ncbi:MAG: hypothetical protein WC967_12210 [Balneolaceae bacterium]
MPYDRIPVDSSMKPMPDEINELISAFIERRDHVEYNLFTPYADRVYIDAPDTLNGGEKISIIPIDNLRYACTNLLNAAWWVNESNLSRLDVTNIISVAGINEDNWSYPNNQKLAVWVPNDIARFLDTMSMLGTNFWDPFYDFESMVETAYGYIDFETARANAFSGLSTIDWPYLTQDMFLGRSGYAYELDYPPIVYDVEALCTKTFTLTWDYWPVNEEYSRVVIQIIEASTVDSPPFNVNVKVHGITVGSFVGGTANAVHNIEMVSPGDFQFSDGTAVVELEFAEDETADPTEWSAPPDGWSGLPLQSEWHQGWRASVTNWELPEVYVYVKKNFEYVSGQ